MKREVKAPSVGESITEVRIGSWKKQNGEAVKTGEVILEIESDKATVEVIAETGGALTITRQAGDTVRIGEVLGFIEEGAAGTVSSKTSGAAAAAAAASAPRPAATASGPQFAAPAAGGPHMTPSARRMATEAGINPGSISGSGSGGTVTKSDVMNYSSGGGASPSPVSVSV